MTPLAAAIRFGLPLAVLASLAPTGLDLLRHRDGKVDAAARALPPVPETAPVAAVDLDAIARLTPFGAPPAPEAEAAPAQAPPVDLILQGVMVSGDPARSAAFIARDGRTERFAVGAEIAPGIVLRAAQPDHVTLVVDGVARSLRFPDAPPVATATPADADRGPDAGAAPDTATLPPGLLAGMVQAPAREEAVPEPPTTVADHVALWRGRIRRNPGQVLDVIGLVPGAGGYTIAVEHARGIRRIGLQAGDVIRRVNGEPVGDPTKDRSLYDRVAASGLVTVEIEREGESFTMSFPLR